MTPAAASQRQNGQGHGVLVTVLVPTHNRYPFLLRLLQYYRDLGAPFPMRVLDSSSDPADSAQLQMLMSALDVDWRRYDAHTLPTPKLYDGIRGVTTPYVVLWADDDLMVPRTIAAGAEFLEAHRDFSVTHGRSGLFELMTMHGGHLIVNTCRYPQPSYLDATAADRLLHYFQESTTLFYSVHRTPNLTKNLERCLSAGLGDWKRQGTFLHRSDVWVEQLLGCLALIQGKAQSLDGLYMMRERHAGVDSWEDLEHRLDFFEFVTSASFARGYQAFSRCLSSALIEAGISIRDAEGAVKRAAWAWCGDRLVRKWRARYCQPHRATQQRWQGVLRRAPRLRRLWRTVRSRLPAQEWMLEALLRPSWPYHEDFMPIYQAIMGVDGVTADSLAEPVKTP